MLKLLLKVGKKAANFQVSGNPAAFLVALEHMAEEGHPARLPRGLGFRV